MEKNKDDNIHKSKSLKRKDKRKLTLVQCQNRISRINLNKILSKFVAKLLKYMIMFKDLLTFLGLNYRTVIGIIIQSMNSIGQF